MPQERLQQTQLQAAHAPVHRVLRDAAAEGDTAAGDAACKRPPLSHAARCGESKSNMRTSQTASKTGKPCAEARFLQTQLLRHDKAKTSKPLCAPWSYALGRGGRTSGTASSCTLGRAVTGEALAVGCTGMRSWGLRPAAVSTGLACSLFIVTPASCSEGGAEPEGSVGTLEPARACAGACNTADLRDCTSLTAVLEPEAHLGLCALQVLPEWL